VCGRGINHRQGLIQVLYVPYSYVADNTLDAATGKPMCRMTHHGLIHLPVTPSAKKPICACHRWAGGRRKFKVSAQILLCKVCKMHLCLECFDKFHTEADITVLRSRVLVSAKKKSHNS
jgi:hypothetical protein